MNSCFYFTSMAFILILVGIIWAQPKKRSNPKRNDRQSSKNEVFSPEWKIVPKSFTGNDFDAIYSSLIRNKAFLDKNEFETRAEFLKRVNNPSKVILDNGSTAKDDLVFVYRPEGYSSPSDIFASYDADSGSLAIKVPTTKYETYK